MPAYPNGMGIVVADEPLFVRTLPEISDASAILPLSLSYGMRFAIDEGPVEASGYEWYRVYVGEIEGWIASASRDGEAWIARLGNGSITLAQQVPPDVRTQVFLVEADGSDLRQISDFTLPEGTSVERGIVPVRSCGGEGLETAKWSVDGSSLLVARGDGSACATDVYLVHPNGSPSTYIGSGYAPDRSPDGSRIAYGENLPYVPCARGCSPEALGPWEIHVRDTDGTEVALTTSEPWVATGTPRWSPDGASLLYHRSILAAPEDPANGVYIIGSDGSGQRLLIAGVNPMWSPDGQHVVVTGCCEPGAEAWIIRADARDPAEAQLLARGVPLGWTPEGRAVLIGPSADDVEAESQLVDISGSVVGQLSIEGGFVGWSPDGTQVLYYRGDGSGAGGAFRADAAGDGSDAQLVAELPPLAGVLGWQPRLEPMD